jgi:hypothetical protein
MTTSVSSCLEAGGALAGPVADLVDEDAAHDLVGAGDQGLTLIHFSAQCKHLLRDRGCIRGI